MDEINYDKWIEDHKEELRRALKGDEGKKEVHLGRYEQWKEEQHKLVIKEFLKLNKENNNINKS